MTRAVDGRRARGRRGDLIAAISLAVVVAVVATVAVVTNGYHSERKDLGDGSVWIARGEDGLVGRANTLVDELNTVVDVGGGSIEVAQRGDDVLVLDAQHASLRIIDPVDSTVLDTVAVPPDVDAFALAGDRLVLAADGDVWMPAIDSLDEFDSSRDPLLSLGAGTIVSVDDAGLLFAFTPSTGLLVSLDVTRADTVQSRWELDPVDESHALQLTSSGGVWALLDSDVGVLRLPDRTIDLADDVPGFRGALLQRASAAGGPVLLAHAAGLVAVDADGTVRVLRDDRRGAPAAPVRVDGCEYAGWNLDAGGGWRRCDDGAGEDFTLAGMPGGADLAFIDNGRDVVLADRDGGRGWGASEQFDLIDNWAELEAERDDDLVVEQQDSPEEPELEKTPVKPVAVDDEVGARPGRTTTLPLLVNDYDDNGDVLVIDSVENVTPVEHAVDLDIVAEGQAVQIELADDASGPIRFTYTISDGTGVGSTASATATVIVRGADENSGPVQVRTPSLVLEAGQRGETDVLSDWVDPDGDPIHLVSAESDVDTVVRRPDGRVTVTADAAVGARRVELSVSDGVATGAGVLDLSVDATGTAPLIAESFVVQTAVNEDVEIDPLVHVSGGSGEGVRLTAVPDVQATVDFEDGTFRFRATEEGTHLLEYSVADGAQTATGTVRIEVSPSAEQGTVPITVPHSAFVQLARSVDVDVLATDFDPKGRVLIITGIDEESLPPEVGVEVIDHRMLRVKLDAPPENGSVVFDYRVSNGLAEATGTVTVIQVAPPAVPQPPIAVDDTATARSGDVISIDVLDNDRHPDDSALSLGDPAIVTAPAAGHLFADGRVLRYLAPEEPGEYTATYRVVDEDGTAAEAEVRILVRGTDLTPNTAPQPETVTARALQGESIRIRVPLTGIDADGDSVQLLGLTSNPTLGLVAETGVDWVDYTAGDYSTGTDQFEYQVVDALGVRSTGVIRVGIAGGLEGASRPVANDDAVAVRPDRTVAIRVLANDTDPDGDDLTIVDVEPVDGAPEPRFDGELVRVAAPSTAGSLEYVYTVRNESEVEASARLTVEVDPDAPLPAPEADDTVLALDEILDRTTVDVDVLENVFFAEGDSSVLEPRLVPGFDEGASVLPDGAIRIEVRDRRRTVPFVVANPEDATRSATALVLVPGRDDAIPQVRSDAPELEVVSGEELLIDIDEHVVAASGRPVGLVDDGEVSASNAAGVDFVVDSRTLRYRSADEYFGPASISFTVEDVAGEGEAAGRTATIVLPILVEPAVDQPPAFTGGRIDFEPGETKRLDLAKLTAYPDSVSADDLEFVIRKPWPNGFDIDSDGSVVAVRADDGIPVDTVATLNVDVLLNGQPGTPGQIRLSVVSSSRPLASARADTAVTPRGATTSIDVLANDEPANPFPGTPLVVTEVRGADAESLPAGVSVSPSGDGSVLTVRVSDAAAPGESVLEYQIQDATGDAGRRVWGTVTISVQDRPEPVTGVRVTGYRLGELDVAFEPGAANNSPITGYEIVLAGPDTGAVLARTDCASTRCTIQTPGEGSDYAARVQVSARNAIGISDAAAAAGLYWSDAVPAAPTGLEAAPLDGGLRISWTPVVTAGSAVGRYVVAVGGAVDDFAAASICSSTRCTVEWRGLPNGQTVQVSVSARNQAAPEFAVWESSSTTGIPFGAPVAGAIAPIGDAIAGSVTVTWDAFADNGDPVLGYFVQRLTGSSPAPPTGSQACTVSSPAPGMVTPPGTGGSVVDVVAVPAGSTRAVFGGAIDDVRDTFVVWGYNRAGCARTDLAGITVRQTPGQIGSVSSQMMFTESGLAYDRYVSNTGGDWSRLEIQAIDSSGLAVPGSVRSFSGTGWPRAILNRPYGEAVRFQIRACTAWGSCGRWSATLPADARPSLNFDVPGRAWDPATATWTWLRDPDNSGIPATYRCGFAGDAVGVPAASPTSCLITGAGPEDAVWLDVQIGGVSVQFTNR
ncbi:Ig-like domain-containing protein [Agromyces seonyuensis]|uniref:Fibronectin type III domain-containing protein n=1 Tax=Agromyces seonyuensis TaxID=2662446 RepID=A0A6I4P207_9MICO|nr:Ig-like domain-containing protein [Agromyces seonyuensis]MWB98775.1 fibronectin type III domain-containing protein [Agromyces seonyuensis]